LKSIQFISNVCVTFVLIAAQGEQFTIAALLGDEFKQYVPLFHDPAVVICR
jgi:hypothetical protein